MNVDDIAGFLKNVESTVSSILKIGFLSRGVTPASRIGRGKTLVILGNGPSLRQTIDEYYERLKSYDMMAVNFAALSDDFIRLRPKYYMLADKHFFNGLATDPNVSTLWNKLRSVNWNMILLVPATYRPIAHSLVMMSKSIRIRTYNLTPVEGFRWLTHTIYSSGLGMPRPRNVLIPALMEGIRLGYSEIIICGADHTWTRTLEVDEYNRVLSVQPHFYEDNEDEHKRVRETYKNLRLHNVLGSMAIAFSSYWKVKEYADSCNVRIFNATPGSMIDAFPRIKGLGHIL